MTPTLKQWTIRMEEKTLARLKDRHAQTFPQHRLSLNRWLVKILEDSLPHRR